MRQGKARVLIVDDSTSLRKTMSFILRRRGYDVAAVGDGLEAIRQIEARPFDVVFLDVKMLPMDGVVTCRRIRQIQPRTAVIMMTAYSVEDMIREALEEGAYGVIYKPLDIERVIALIDETKAAAKGALVLVVDDDPGTSATFASILSRKGYLVSIAATGEEAVAQVRQKEYDVVFVEVTLPTINGLETYLSIRDISPQTVVVMMTTMSQEVGDLVDRALCNKAYACLYKPLDMDKVLALVGSICEQR